MLNTGGFYDSLQSFVRSAVERRFIRPACLQIYALLPAGGNAGYLEQYDAAALDVRHLKISDFRSRLAQLLRRAGLSFRQFRILSHSFRLTGTQRG